MRKYVYWHLIEEISKEYKKRHQDINAGMLMGHYPIKNGWVQLMDMTTGEQYAGYKLRYLFRLPKDSNAEAIMKKYKERERELKEGEKLK